MLAEPKPETVPLVQVKLDVSALRVGIQKRKGVLAIWVPGVRSTVIVGHIYLLYVEGSNRI